MSGNIGDECVELENVLNLLWPAKFNLSYDAHELEVVEANLQVNCIQRLSNCRSFNMSSYEKNNASTGESSEEPHEENICDKSRAFSAFEWERSIMSIDAIGAENTTIPLLTDTERVVLISF